MHNLFCAFAVYIYKGRFAVDAVHFMGQTAYLVFTWKLSAKCLFLQILTSEVKVNLCEHITLISISTHISSCIPVSSFLPYVLYIDIYALFVIIC